MQTVTINDGQKLPVVAQPVDAQGNPGVITGPTTWSTDTPAVATVTVDPTDPTGNTALVTALIPGSALIQAHGVNPGTFFTGFNLTVNGGPAVSFLFVFGTPS